MSTLNKIILKSCLRVFYPSNVTICDMREHCGLPEIICKNVEIF